MTEPIRRDDVLNLDSLQFEELGRAPRAGRQSDIELFPDVPRGVPEPHIGGHCVEESREFLRHDFRGIV